MNLEKGNKHDDSSMRMLWLLVVSNYSCLLLVYRKAVDFNLVSYNLAVIASSFQAVFWWILWDSQHRQSCHLQIKTV